jgi:hypothetical protein
VSNTAATPKARGGTKGATSRAPIEFDLVVTEPGTYRVRAWTLSQWHGVTRADLEPGETPYHVPGFVASWTQVSPACDSPEDRPALRLFDPPPDTP